MLHRGRNYELVAIPSPSQLARKELAWLQTRPAVVGGNTSKSISHSPFPDHSLITLLFGPEHSKSETLTAAIRKETCITPKNGLTIRTGTFLKNSPMRNESYRFIISNYFSLRLRSHWSLTHANAGLERLIHHLIHLQNRSNRERSLQQESFQRRPFHAEGERW